MLRLESMWLLAALVGALAFPSVGSRWFEKLERRFTQAGMTRLLLPHRVRLTVRRYLGQQRRIE
jgi:hypothetical protein